MKTERSSASPSAIKVKKKKRKRESSSSSDSSPERKARRYVTLFWRMSPPPPQTQSRSHACWQVTLLQNWRMPFVLEKKREREKNITSFFFLSCAGNRKTRTRNDTGLHLPVRLLHVLPPAVTAIDARKRSASESVKQVKKSFVLTREGFQKCDQILEEREREKINASHWLFFSLRHSAGSEDEGKKKKKQRKLEKKRRKKEKRKAKKRKKKEKKLKEIEAHQATIGPTVAEQPKESGRWWSTHWNASLDEDNGFQFLCSFLTGFFYMSDGKHVRDVFHLCAILLFFAASERSSRAMKPMTKEEWEKQQAELRHEVDPETGRKRCLCVWLQKCCRTSCGSEQGAFGGGGGADWRFRSRWKEIDQVV